MRKKKLKFRCSVSELIDSNTVNILSIKNQLEFTGKLFIVIIETKENNTKVLKFCNGISALIKNSENLLRGIFHTIKYTDCINAFTKKIGLTNFKNNISVIKNNSFDRAEIKELYLFMI